VTTAIAGRVRLEVAPERLARLDRRQTANAAAYDAYLRARFFENQRNRESVSRAIQFYQQAVTLDPDYALAWAGLSFTYGASAINSDADPREVTSRARQAATNAMRANTDLPEAQFAVGYVHWLLDWNWQEAESAFRRAITLDASLVAAHRTLGHVLSQMGTHSAAELAMEQTRTLDPLSPMTYALSAQIAYQARDNAAALKYAKRATLVDSRFWIGHAQLAQAYAQTGETDVALETLTDAARFAGGENSKTVSLRGYIMASLGRTVEARQRWTRCPRWHGIDMCRRTRSRWCMRDSATVAPCSTG
jgi:tetratricopeptide (TPR) repeat protein